MEVGKAKKIGGFSVQPIFSAHSVECYSYIINHPEFGKLVFATDVQNFPYKINNVTHWLIEANYDEDIVVNKASTGDITNSSFFDHLSIQQAIQTLKINKCGSIQSVILIHLSDENSDERKFIEKVKKELFFYNVLAAHNGDILELNKEEF